MSRINHLNDQFKKVYFNRVFLFNNSQIIEEWLELVGSMETMDLGEDEKDVKDLVQNSRPFVLYLVTLYMFSGNMRVFISAISPL